MADQSMTSTFRVSLPKELVSASARATPPKLERLHVDGWRGSWLSKISELLVGKE